MTITELQKAIGVHPDGLWGNLSRKALLHTFTSSNTAALSADQASLIAKRLGVSAKQLSAVGKVEAAGSGFDKDKRPKILFERHNSTNTPAANIRSAASATRSRAATMKTAGKSCWMLW